ncbi:MAG: cytochrome c-type biogenesis CcmF C-terminal domain-containing protein, partial [Burkholderiales bacterium]
GVGVFIVGVTLVNGYESEKDVRMTIGSTIELGGYAFRLAAVEDVQGPNYEAARGRIEAIRNGRVQSVLHPEKRFYPVQKQTMTEAAIDTEFSGDIYVALGEQVAGDAWTVRVHLKPFVDWIWAGCVLMALGGLIAVCDRRYRRFKRPAPERVPGTMESARELPVMGTARSAQG